MRHSLISVLLLTTVALSTSEVLPIVTIKQLEPEIETSEHRVNENIFNDRLRDHDISNDIFYKVSIGSSRNPYTPLLIPQKSSVVYVKNNGNEDGNNGNEDVDNDRINKENNYDNEGFRKEQWHNYPRQLDRLQKYLYQHHQYDTKVNTDGDDPDDISKSIYDIEKNYINRKKKKNEHDISDTVVAANSPLLVLKIRLAYLKNNMQNTDLNDYVNAVPIELIPNTVLDEKDQEILNPIIRAVKMKRDDFSNSKDSDFSDNGRDSKKTVNKRIFSLWSRLQSLSHKGHELHHRRHLHAFYGFPDDDGSGSGALTAETRAFIRPPGSPLRWG